MDKGFKVDDRVIYISNKHGESPLNPLWGGKEGKVVGTVLKVRPGISLTYRVKWDNDKINGYYYSDLKLHEDKQGGSKVMAQSERVSCLNEGCTYHSYGESDGGNCQKWSPHGLNKKCDKFQGTGSIAAISTKAQLITTKAKGIATSIRTTIKPYEKYLGLVVLALVIDHFLLDGKFAHKFKELAEVIVTKIQSGLDKMTEKLTGEWFTDGTDGEGK